MESPKISQDPSVAATNRLDYEKSIELYQELVRIRFQLLGLLPAVSGAILLVLEVVPLQPAVIVGPALLGLLTTLGVALYEIRNSQIHDNLIHRLRHLERLAGFDPATPSHLPGGFFVERTLRQLFIVPATSEPPERNPEEVASARPSAKVVHDNALALVYGAVLAAWAATTAYNVALSADSSAPVAWACGGATAILMGAIGGRVVSALSRTGRNVERIYLLGPLAQELGDDWPDKAHYALTTLGGYASADGKAPTFRLADLVGKGLKDAELQQLTTGVRQLYQLAIATGVLAHRRALAMARLRNHIEIGDTDKDSLRRASLGAIVGLAEVDSAGGNEKRAMRSLVNRFGNAPWCQSDEVHYRVEWLRRLDRGGLPSDKPSLGSSWRPGLVPVAGQPRRLPTQ